ncbi:hypothetical protein [Rhodococcus koreensis]|uniref:hypothetical protein n=1 Tax=Rhodococcus koreensis TaxID=99653 RepID=UPI003672160A
MPKDIYTELARRKPIAPILGGVYATLVQAHPGREEPYNRWYEDDHFITGGTSGPWIFAGRRFHRTDFPPLRCGDDAPGEPGSFITLYFALAGHVAESAHWIREMWHSLNDEGRGARDRNHLYSSMHDVAFAHVFDPAPMAAIHALSYPYRGLAVEFYDAPEASGRGELVAWLRDELLPQQNAPTGQCLALVPTVTDDDRLGAFGWETGILERRVCVLWLFREEPEELWPGSFADHAGAADSAGLGTLSYQTVFAPTLPGTPTPLTRE